MVNIPLGYNSFVPTASETKKLQVKLSVQLEKILEVRAMESTINIKFRVIANWKDERLIFVNLQPSDNVIDYGSWQNIWTPDFMLKDTKQFIKTSFLPDEKSSFVHVELINISDYTSEYKTIRNDFYYRGSNVEIFKDNRYTIDFICDLDWRMYPFDTQDCNARKLRIIRFI